MREASELSIPRAASTILFVGHDAYRAGAQIALLHLVRWLSLQFSGRLVILLKEGGELLEEYQRVAPTYVLHSEPGPSNILSRAARRFRYGSLRRNRRPAALRALEKLRVDLIYMNSAASLDVLGELREIWKCPVVCHVHELEMGIQRSVGRDAFVDIAKGVDALVSVSAAVTANLCQTYGLPGNRVHTIHEAIALPESGSRSEPAVKQAREMLGVPADGFIVGGCGTLDWRKGPDVFVHIARQLRATRPDVDAYFVWIGGPESGREAEGLEYDVKRLGLASRVRFVAPQPTPQALFAGFEVFLLSSREDPFPLVCLEAASLELPIVCFATSGGIPEFVGTDAGVIVPYLDINGAAAALATLADSSDLRRRLGQRAAEKIKDYDIGVLGKRILELIESLVRASPSCGTR